ncbi:nucleotidyltransferase domain-containing protein [Natronospora cellulosivora (SeqCode)]
MEKINNKLEINKYLKDITNKVVPEVSPEKIYLFGSYATNNYDSDSDIDLFFVVNSNDSLRKIQRKISSLLKDRLIPMDIIVYSQEKMEKHKNIIGTLPYRIKQEGELIYEK